MNKLYETHPALASYLMEKLDDDIKEIKEALRYNKARLLEMKMRVKTYPGGEKVWGCEVKDTNKELKKCQARKQFLLKAKKELSK